MRRTITVTIATLLASLFMAIHADDPQLTFQGEGTADSPFLLSTAEDIVALAKACEGEAGSSSGLNAGHYSGIHFAVTADIDMSGVEGFLGIGAAPYGSLSSTSWNFAGIIDGQGHTISNMSIKGLLYDEQGLAVSSTKTGSRSYVGFVGTLKSPGQIRNLHIDGSCLVEGYTATGSIVGEAGYGTIISGCSSRATVRNIKKNSGGIAGKLSGSASAGGALVEDCVFAGLLQESTEAAGGIAGRNERSTISGCTNLGRVTCQSFNAATTPDKQSQGAGIVGYNYYGTVSDCMNAGEINVSYQKAGGIVGYNANADAKVMACVNIGPVITPDRLYVGAVVGHNFRSGTASNYKYGVVSDCYHDMQLWGENPGYQIPEGCSHTLPTRQLVSGVLPSGLDPGKWIAEEGFYPRPAGNTLQEETRRAAAMYVLFQPDQGASDFVTSATVSRAMEGIKASMETGRWFTVEDDLIIALEPQETVSDTINLTNGDFVLRIPVLKSPVVFDGSGTADDPFIISEKKHLIALASLCNNGNIEHFNGIHFRMTADIDMENDPSFNGIASKNTNAYNSEQTYYFSGVFDGGGHTVSNLDITGVVFDDSGVALEYTRGSTGNVGFFGALGDGAVVKDLRIISSRIQGYYNVGGITGYMADNASVSGCLVDAQIICYDSGAGGIAGYGSGSYSDTPARITRCVFTGSVTANNSQAGGIAGSNSAIITECVNLGNVSVEMFNDCNLYPKLYRAGGIAGQNTGEIHSCLNIGNVHSQGGEAGGLVGFNTNGVKRGHMTGCLSVSQVTASDVSMSGGLIGQDYRLSLSTSTPIIIENNYYDSQYSSLRGSGNMDRDGLSGAPTSSLTSGVAPAGFGDEWATAGGRYPVPAATAASFDIVERGAATYILVNEPSAVYNFGNEATIASSMEIEAHIEGGDGVFRIEDGKIKATQANGLVRASLTLTNGAYSRQLTLTKTGLELQGDGSESNPYLIATADDFITFSNFVAEHRTGFEGEHFMLTDDIDFTGKDFPVVGSEEVFFSGILDGNGHSVSGIAYTAPADRATGAGLFGAIGENGVVRNLTVSGCSFIAGGTTGSVAGICLGKLSGITVGADVSVIGTQYSSFTSELGNEIGGIAGRLYSTARVEDCVNKAYVEGNKMVGGIAGASRDDDGCVIARCVNEGNITGAAPRETSFSGGVEVSNYVETMTGGIAGRFTGDITECVNRGRVSTTVCNAVGGIVGKGYIAIRVKDCLNEGEIHSAYAYAGGILGITTVTAGSDVSTLVENCANTGRITGMSSLGGITGVGANGCLITDCRNQGEITSSLGRAGGMIGEVSQMVTVKRSFNSAPVSASMLAGGIIGDSPTMSSLTVTQCYNTGDISSGANGGAAGIINATGGSSSVSECYNTGNVEAARFAGGIAGRCSGLTLGKCWSNGTVTPTSSNASFMKSVGTIAGAAMEAEIEGCMYPAYLTPLAGDAESDGITAVTLADMFASSELLGDGFVYAPLCFPMLAGMDDTDVAKVNSAFYMPEDGGNPFETSGNLELSSLEGVEWSASGPVVIEEGIVKPTGEGEACLTATAGEASRTYDITVVNKSAIDMMPADEDAWNNDGDIRFYDLNGRSIDRPSGNSPYLRVITGPDGKRRSSIVMAIPE